MFRRIIITLLFGILSASMASAEPHRLEILFLGDNGHHDPIERYRVIKQALGPQGYNFSYVEDLKKITKENLNRHDVLVVYANHEKNEVPADILPWVKEGGALVALHCAAGNFHPSQEWFDLIGGRFKSHETNTFSPQTIDSDNPITKGLPLLNCFDETYVHQSLTPDRHLLQVRAPMNKGETAPEPWTWTRTEGKGRVFYTASGHDLRCWNEPAYQELVRRAILWTLGDKKAEEFSQLKIPPLEMETPDVPNRTHPEIPMMQLQKPLSPADSAAHTQVPVGTRLELFASEPMVINPIAIDWDTKGRAWVVESFGYPNDVPDEPGSGKDKIKILVDTDGDGKADNMTVFAEGLRHCTTSVFVKNGVVVTDGKDIVYLGDDDGDGKSEIRKVLATGLNMNDTHAATSHFEYGYDNWLYATVGYSGVNISLSDGNHKFGQGVFRFRPDLSKLELLQNTTNNTWGLGIDEEGDITGSTANNNPSWIVSIPSAAYAGSGITQPRTPRLDTAVRLDNRKTPPPGPRFPKMFPNTRDVTQVDQIEGYTAAAGHDYHTDRVLKDTFSPNNAFICEPTGHIVTAAEVLPFGSIKQTFLRGNNAFASSDAWAAPVAARVGPDGALWIADWCNPIVQHNVVFRYFNAARGYDQPHSPFQSGAKKGPGKGNAYETPLRDNKHGRIWRIVPRDGKIRKETGIDPSNSSTLVSALSSPSQVIRLHAQRLLVEKADQKVIPSLEKLITAAATPEGCDSPLTAIHAIWTIEGLGALPESDAHRVLADALKSSHPLIRRHAMMALTGKDSSVISELPSFIEKSDDPRELLYILTTAALSTPDPKIAASLHKRLAAAESFDDTLQEAGKLALRRQGMTLLTADFSTFPATPKTWYETEILAIIRRLASGQERATITTFATTAPTALRTHIENILTGPREIDRTPIEVPSRFIVGRDLYMKACIECHQADGKGVKDTFPPLAGSEWVKGHPDAILRIVLGGLSGPVEINGQKFNGVMPGHAHVSDDEIASIVNFVRFAFGGVKEEPISPTKVKALRPEVEKRKFVPWNIKELEALKP